MIYINLLPWREHAALDAKKEFIKHSIIASIGGATIVVAWFLTTMGLVDQQLGINARLEAASKDQQKKIVEIQDLKADIQILLERKKVVESLQNNRNQATRIYEQLALKLPPGVQLKSIFQKGNIVKLNGYAQNNSLLSKTMADLATSEWFKNPILIEAKAVDVKVGSSTIKASEFTLNITYYNPEEVSLKTVDVKDVKKGGLK